MPLVSMGILPYTQGLVNRNGGNSPKNLIRRYNSLMEMNALTDWLEDQIGRTKRFKSPRALSIAAGLSQNTVGSVLEKGRGDPETLLAIADAVGVPKIRLFVLAGWLKTQDLEDAISAGYAKNVAEDDYQLQQVIRGWGRLSPEGRAILLGGLQEALKQTPR